MKSLRAFSALCLLVATLSCGSSSKHSTTAGSLSGNWQFTLTRHNNTEQWIFSGFLMQSGKDLTGSFILGAGCQGVGPVTGTFDGQNLQLTIGEFGQDFTLSASVASGGSSTDSMKGQFTTPQGACLAFSSSGDWTAVRIPALSGPFHGSFVTPGVGGLTVDVTGTLTQGPNIGASTATLSGTIQATGSASFCSYLSTATINGLISGNSVTLNLFGPDGLQIAQIPAPTFPLATVNSDATTLTGSFSFPQISSSCPGFSGGSTGMTLTFP